jgi:hypothetical protein
MVGNIGEIILNPNIAANIVKYRVTNVRFSISLHQTLRYKKVSGKSNDLRLKETALISPLLLDTIDNTKMKPVSRKVYDRYA